MSDLRWFVVELEYEACGGHGCRGRTETEIVAAEEEQAALALVDDEDAVRAYVAALELPDLSRKRKPLRYGAPHTFYRPAPWEAVGNTSVAVLLRVADIK